jgi:hypothetical protein
VFYNLLYFYVWVTILCKIIIFLAACDPQVSNVIIKEN